MKKILYSLVLCGLSFTAASAQYVRPTQQTAFASEAATTAAAAAHTPSNELPAASNTWMDAPSTTSSVTALEAPRGRRQATPRRRFAPRFAALADLGIGGVIDANVTVGAQLFPFFYIGGGLNASYWHSGFDNRDERADFNVIVNPRFEIPTHSIVTPFFDLKFGYALTHNNGGYVALGTGVQIQNFTIGLGFSGQVTGDDSYYDYVCDGGRGCLRDYDNNYQGVTLRLGLKF